MWIPWLNVTPSYIVLFILLLYQLADVFEAVVTLHRIWFATPFNNTMDYFWGRPVSRAAHPSLFSFQQLRRMCLGQKGVLFVFFLRVEGEGINQLEKNAPIGHIREKDESFTRGSALTSRSEKLNQAINSSRKTLQALPSLNSAQYSEPKQDLRHFRHFMTKW